MKEKIAKWLKFDQKRFENWQAIILSLCVIGTYTIKRGFTLFAKAADIMGPLFKDALAIYFMTYGFAKFGVGIFLDNVSSRLVFLIATVLGTVGLCFITTVPLLFGVCFGIAATLVMLASFSTPMKHIEKAKGTTVWLQAGSKNLAVLLFLGVVATVLIPLGWGYFTGVAASVFFITGMLAVILLPDRKVKGWELSMLVAWTKDYRFWCSILYLAINGVIFYTLWGSFWPAFKAMGIPPYMRLLLIAGGPALGFAVRYPGALLGDYIGNWKVLAVQIVLYGVLIWTYQLAPIVCFYLFCALTALHTPNWWAAAKKWAGEKYVATISGMGYGLGYILLTYVVKVLW